MKYCIDDILSVPQNIVMDLNNVMHLKWINHKPKGTYVLIKPLYLGNGGGAQLKATGV